MTSRPRDRFEEYYAEKLWEMIPGVYRYEDALARNGGVLRALVEVLAEQAAILRRSQDRLWEDQFIELCDDWVVPYLADLVGTRLVSAKNQRGRRVDVAKTIYYRRRAGTLRVLEELISDITDWEGTVVECFRRLARTRHGLDPKPRPLAGRLSATLPGGWADLRRPVAAQLPGTPFDEYHHTADVRQHRGLDGRYGIPKLAFHLYRLAAFRVAGVAPRKNAAGDGFVFDPSGRDVPLFMKRNRPEKPGDWQKWRSAREWELPAPMRCRVLGHAEFEITDRLVVQLVKNNGLGQAPADELRLWQGVRFPSEHRLRLVLERFTHSASLLAPVMYEALLASALVEDCGKRALVPDAVKVEEVPGGPVGREQIVAGNLEAWAANAPGKRLVIDPERGRFRFLGAPPADCAVTYHYGFSGKIGAGTYDRCRVDERQPDKLKTGGGALPHTFLMNGGVAQVNDSATYSPVSDKFNVQRMTLQAANQERPYLRLTTNWVLRTKPNQDAVLVLDGLWLGSEGPDAVILRGDYEHVHIRSCTFDPGGKDMDNKPILPVPLVVEAQVEKLTIEKSIMGPILTLAGGVVEQMEVDDSIIHSIDSGVAALVLPDSQVYLTRVTILGKLVVNRLWASEVLITAKATVTNTQEGCFRFSAAPPDSRLPRRYESHVILEPGTLFTSDRYGDPGYGQLSETAPLELRRGAEDGSELGAFSNLGNPIKLDSLQAKVEEYMPFGLIPLFVYET